MITTFRDAQRRNEAVGHFWFAPGTMKFHGTRLLAIHPAPYGAYFAYVNRDQYTGTKIRVAYINDAGYVNPSYTGIGAGHLSRDEWNDLMDTAYDTAEEAIDAAKEKARTAWANK